MRNFDQEMVKEYRDADQGGSDFIDSLPTPEIKTTEDLIAAATPAPPAPKPTDAMLRGTEMSQTQFEGMEPVYESTGPREGQKELVGYKFGMNQIQEPGMVASYSAPVYAGGRAGERELVDPGGKLLGYDYTGPVEVPKPANVLAYEKQFGTTMEPIYDTRARETRGGEAQVAYGPPIGYRFDNGNSQYVNFDATGTYQNTQNRERPGALGNIVLSVLSIAYPPIAPFIQAYNAVKALDNGDTLGFILSAAGASAKIPGLDKSTISMLNDVSTGAKIIKAVESKDPLAIASSMVTLPGVPADVKNTLDIVNTAKAVSRGDINALIGVAQKYGGNVSRTADTVTVDGTTYDINNTPAGASDTPESSMTTTFDAQIATNLRNERNAQELATQESEDRKQTALEQIRASERNIEDTLTDSGLVSTDSSVDTVAQEQADREQAAREAIRAQEAHDAQVAQDAQDAKDRQEAIDKAVAEAKEASDKADADAKAAKDKEAADKAAADKVIADKSVADAKAEQEAHDAQVAKDAQDAKDRQEAIDKAAQEQAAQEQSDREQAAREAVRESERAIEAAQLAQEQTDREQADLETKRVAQEQEDREQSARDAIKASEKTIEDTLIDAGLVRPTDVQELSPVTVTEKAITDNELFLDTIAQEQEDREQAARDAVRASEKTIEDQLADSGLVSKTDDEKKLEGVEVTGKALTDTDLPITGDQGRNRVTDSSLPVNPNVGTTTPTLERKEISGKREIDTDLPVTSDTGSNRVSDSSLPVNPNVGEPLQEFKPVTVTGKRDQELDPVTITEKRIVDEEPTPDGGALKPVTIIGKKETPVIPKPPVIPKVPTTTTKPTPAKPSPKKPATPEEQFYQTVTQSQPTTLADIKYYLDMASGGMVPPENSPNPLESLLNQPMSVEELLYYLRS